MSWNWSDLHLRAASYYSVRLWLLRLGLHQLNRPKTPADDWMWIVDHTMQLGERKCLIIVAIRQSAWEAKERVLSHEDVELIDLAPVTESNGQVVHQQLKNAAAKIKAAGKYSGFCMGADWARFAPFVFGAGGAYASTDNKTATLNSAEVKTAADFIAGMKADGSLATSADVGAGWCGEAVGKKLAAMTYEGGWMVNYMRTTFPDVKWKAVPLPAGPKGKADVIFTNGIGVNAATKYPRASAALVMFITGAYNQGLIVKTGFAYSTQQSQIDLVVDPNDKAIAQGGTFPLTRVAFWGPNTGKVNDAVSKALNSIFLGASSVADSLAQAQTDVQAVLSGQ